MKSRIIILIMALMAIIFVGCGIVQASAINLDSDLSPPSMNKLVDNSSCFNFEVSEDLRKTIENSEVIIFVLNTGKDNPVKINNTLSDLIIENSNKDLAVVFLNPTTKNNLESHFLFAKSDKANTERLWRCNLFSVVTRHNNSSVLNYGNCNDDPVDGCEPTTGECGGGSDGDDGGLYPEDGDRFTEGFKGELAIAANTGKTFGEGGGTGCASLIDATGLLDSAGLYPETGD